MRWPKWRKLPQLTENSWICDIINYKGYMFVNCCKYIASSSLLISSSGYVRLWWSQVLWGSLSWIEVAVFMSFQKYLMITLQIVIANLVIALIRIFFCCCHQQHTYKNPSPSCREQWEASWIFLIMALRWLIWAIYIYITYWYGTMHVIYRGPFKEACQENFHGVDL
jgi:hypothetical protein